jgi:hypothetical protein
MHIVSQYAEYGKMATLNVSTVMAVIEIQVLKPGTSSTVCVCMAE